MSGSNTAPLPPHPVTGPGAGQMHLPGERPLFNPWMNRVHSGELSFPTRHSVRSVRATPKVAGEQSVYLEWGTGSDIVKMIVAVRGPRQQSVTRSKFEVDVSFASFACRDIETSQFERDLAAYVREAIEGVISLDAYPFCAIYMDIKVLEAGSTLTSLLAPAITAASLACHESGIIMQEDVVAVTVGVCPNGDFLVDPEDRFLSLIPCCTVAVGTKTHRMTFLHTSGVLSGSDVVESIVHIADSLAANLSSRLVDKE